ncbi:hypothetical protein HDU78_006812, partial [Chytriomyces hyalinus]
YERFIESEMASFCAQDEHIQLLWKSARNYHQPMFTCDWSKRAAQVPWRILITHVNKHGADGHFLPAYSPGGAVNDGAAEGSHNSTLPFLVARVQGTLLNPDPNGTRRVGGAGGEAGSRSAAAATSPSPSSLALSPASAESAAEGGSHHLPIPSVTANKALPSGKRKKENGRTRSNENGASSSSTGGAAREFVDSAPLRSDDDDDDEGVDDPDFSGDLRMTKTGTQVSKPPSYRSYIA